MSDGTATRRPPTPAPATDPVPRPALRPGLRVVRRADRLLQVGIDPPHRLIGPDQPDVRRVLDDLAAGRPPTPSTPDGRRFVAGLLEGGLLVDGVDLDDALAGAGDRAAVAAVFAQFGSDAPRRLAARAAATVAVDAPAEIRQSAARLLRASGIGVTGEDTGATAVLVAGSGELSRDRLDPLVRAGVAHLVVTGGPGGLTLGPFVVPGVTACLRCVDAHRGENDPRRATVVEQCAQDGPRPEQRDPALVAIAVGWAVRDLVGYVDGDRPGTWSTSVVLGPGLDLVRRRWGRHPHCGCSWGGALAAG